MDLKQYKAQQEKRIQRMQKELDMLEASGLEVEITIDRWNNKLYSIDDYTKATDYEIRKGCGCCADTPYLLRLFTNISTEHGDFKVYNGKASVRGEIVISYGDWGCIEDEESLTKLSDLIVAYKCKGVKEELLERIEESVKFKIETEKEEQGKSVTCV